MIVGVDVTHPAPGSMQNTPSIVGVVASINNQLSQWWGNARLQESRQEIQKRRQDPNKENYKKDAEDMVEGHNLTILMKERLMCFKDQNNGRFPAQILIYRDGRSFLPHRQIHYN